MHPPRAAVSIAACLVLLLGGAPSPAGAAEAPGAAALRRLLAVRDALHHRLAERMRADAAAEAPVDAALLLENGLEHHGTRAYSTASGIEMIPLRLRLRRRGGRWLDPRVAVPGELGEWLRVLSVETGALALSTEAMTGRAALVARLGRPGRPDIGRGNTSHGHLKSGTKPVLEWHVGREGVRPHAQEFVFDARLIPERWNFDLTFHGGLRGTRFNERIKQETSWAKDLHLTRRWLREDFAIREGRSPTHNKAVHTHDGSGLRLEGGRLVGTLIAKLQPDSWVAGGVQTYEIDAPLAGGRLVEGRYRVAGAFGEHEGRVSGHVGRALAGTYRTAAYGREWQGAVMGTLIDAPSAPQPIDPDGDAARLRAATAPAARVALGARLYRETAGLLRALRAYPLAWQGAARAQTVRTPVEPDAGAAARYLECLAAVAETAAAAVEASPAGGGADTEDTEFGPYFDAAPLEPAADGGHRLPAETGRPGPQRWAYPTRWEFLGPFVTHGPAAGEAVVLPELAPVAGLDYAQDWRDDGRLHLAGRVAGFRAETAADGAARLPRGLWDPLFVRSKRLSTYGDHMAETKDDRERRCISEESRRACHWYARTTLHAAEDRTVHLAIRGKHGGQLWVNDRLRWRAGQAADSRGWSVFPVDLHAGANRLLVRAGEGITYFPGWGKGWTPDTAAAARSWLRLRVCTRGRPRSAADAAAGRAAEVAAMDAARAATRGPLGDGTARFPDAEPPLAWDLEAGTNLAWKRELPAGAADPVVWEDRLFVAAEPAALHCLDRVVGEELWSAVLPAAGDVEDTAAATPLVDAESVWVHYGTGTVVAFDHAGRERWRAATGAPWSRLRHAAPVLAGSDDEGRRVLAVVCPDEERDADDKRRVLHQVVAYDADSGEELWRRAGLPRAPVGLLHLPLIRGETRVDALVDADGAVLASADGTLLRAPLDPHQWGRDPGWAIPARRVGARVLLGHAETALRLWLEADGRVGRRILYHHHRAGGANPVAAPDGLIYVLRVTEEHSGHGPTPWDMLQVIDAESGFTVAKHKPALRDATRPISTALVDDGLLYLTDNGGGLGAKDDAPKLAIMQAGEVPLPLVDQAFVRTPSHPVFAGERMYLQGGGAVWCLAATDAAGRRFQDETVARSLLRGRLGKPAPVAVTDIPAADGYRPPTGMDVTRLGRYSTPSDWLFAGTFPLGDADADPLAPFGDPPDIRAIGADTAVAWSGVEHPFAPLPEEVLARIGSVQEYYQGERSFRSIYGLEYVKAMGCAEHVCAYFFAVLESPLEATYRIRQRSRGVRAWLGGVPIEHGQTIRLPAGFHPLLMRVDIRTLPPFEREWLEERMRINLILRRVPDPRDELRRWRDELRAYRRWLERFATRLPDTRLGRTAAIYLRYADGEVPLTGEEAGE